MSTLELRNGGKSDQLIIESAIENLKLIITQDQEIGDVLQKFQRQSFDVDVHIIAGDKLNQKLFKVHESILKIRSDYFKIALSDQWVRKDQNGIIIFRKENISPEIFDLLLDYIYTGKVSVPLCNINIDFVDLIVAADEILLPQLVISLEGHLIDMYLSKSIKPRNVEKWLQSNIIRLVSIKEGIPEGLNLVRSRFEEHVRIAGHDSIREIIPSNKEAIVVSKIYINTLLKVFKKYNRMVQTIFKNEAGFVESFNESCHEFINCNKLCTNSIWLSSHLLVEYCDLFLRYYKKGSIVNIKNGINNIIIIFKYLHDKDVFEKFYSQMLAERLLTQCSISEEAELIMISRLEEECGHEYASKMRLMFYNIELSKDLNNQFKEHLNADDAKQVDFYVWDMETWPIPPITPEKIIPIPDEIEKNFQRFKAFYKNKYPSRKLKLLYHLSKCELEANYLKTPKVFQVSTYQMIILLQYNKNTSYTFQQLCQSTGIDWDLMKIQLNCLVNKRVILKGEYDGLETKYILNFRFNSEANQIKLKDPEETMQHKRKYKHERELEIKISQRKFKLSMTVHGIVSRSRGIKYVALVQETISQLSNTFKVKIPDIKKEIKNLIEREYINCVDGRYYKI